MNRKCIPGVLKVSLQDIVTFQGNTAVLTARHQQNVTVDSSTASVSAVLSTATIKNLKGRKIITVGAPLFWQRYYHDAWYKLLPYITHVHQPTG